MMRGWGQRCRRNEGEGERTTGVGTAIWKGENDNKGGVERRMEGEGDKKFKGDKERGGKREGGTWRQ